MFFKTNIEKETEKNKDYRRVLDTNSKQQLVVMSLNPYEEIGNEIHKTISQFIRIEEGSGYAIIGNKKKVNLKGGDCIIIDPNTYHNILAGKDGIKLYSVYSPPKHEPDCVQKYKDDREC
jgi:mannose-6-phosphate isomerase-like protein (cupin superfamily)